MQAAVEHCEGRLEKEQEEYEQTKKKLEERNSQLADKEKEVNELKTKMEMAEKLCARLERQLAGTNCSQRENGSVEKHAAAYRSAVS